MAKFKHRLAFFVVGSIAAASGAACTSGGSPSVDDGDLNRDDVQGEVAEVNASNPTAVAVACGDFATLGSDSPSIDDEGHIVVEDAYLTVSISDEGDRRVSTSDDGLTVGVNSGITGETTTLEGDWDIPGGHAQIYFKVGQKEFDGDIAEFEPDISIDASEVTLGAKAFSRGVNVPPASVYSYRPDVEEVYADVTTMLDAGIAHVGFEGNMNDSQGLGVPFLGAESIGPEKLDDSEGTVFTKTLRENAREGDVVGISVSNIPNVNDPNAPMISCVGLAVVTQDLGL